MARKSSSFGQGILQALLGTLVLVAGLASYLAVLKWRGPAATLITQTAWDRVIPFQPAWLWVYVAPYPLAPAILGLMDPATFRWFIKRALLIMAVSLLVFVVVPSQTVRPSFEELGDGWTAKYYREMVAVDEPPANAAPSLHVSLTCLLAIALLRDHWRLWPIVIGGVALVWLATLFTWQHHLIDVATGALLGLLVAIPYRGTGSRIAK
jgi:membrane-associated phospholipid phosphatase